MAAEKPLRPGRRYTYKQRASGRHAIEVIYLYWLPGAHCVDGWRWVAMARLFLLRDLRGPGPEVSASRSRDRQQGSSNGFFRYHGLEKILRT